MNFHTKFEEELEISRRQNLKGPGGIILTKRSLLIKSILEVPWVHCNGLYEMNTCSYGSFIKVVTFMRAFCNLIVESREK